MQEDANALDADIIRSAYAERVKDIFKVFAESLSMGEKEVGSRERLVRSLEMLRRSRDVALEVLHEMDSIVEPTAQPVKTEADAASADDLPEELRRIVDQAVGETTGQKQFGR